MNRVGTGVSKRWLALATGVETVTVSVLERGLAFVTGIGAAMAGVSFEFAVVAGATMIAASSLVAASKEVRNSSQEVIITGQAQKL